MIDQCQLQSLTPSVLLAEQVYVIGEPALTLDIPSYQQQPDCNLPLTISLASQPALDPTVLRLDPNDPFKLLVQTDDFALRGLYTVTITATADGGVSDSSQQF